MVFLDFCLEQAGFDPCIFPGIQDIDIGYTFHGVCFDDQAPGLVLSLIMQCKVSVVHGYAALAAYRFLPELQAQVDSIHLAQEIRGIPWNKNLFSRFTSPFRVLLPLISTAARRGERVACAMESRGLGRQVNRSFYVRIGTDRSDWLFLAVVFLLYGLLVLFLVKFNLFHFSFAFAR